MISNLLTNNVKARNPVGSKNHNSIAYTIFLIMSYSFLSPAEWTVTVVRQIVL